MKVKIEMIVEISKDAEDFEIESHLRDALTMYEGNDIEFWDCDIQRCLPAISKFEENHGGKTFICLETFEAIHANSIAGKKITLKQTFVKGYRYFAESWRPEGMHVFGFFVFNKDASKFAVFE